MFLFSILYVAANNNILYNHFFLLICYLDQFCITVF